MTIPQTSQMASFESVTWPYHLCEWPPPVDRFTLETDYPRFPNFITSAFGDISLLASLHGGQSCILRTPSAATSEKLAPLGNAGPVEGPPYDLGRDLVRVYGQLTVNAFTPCYNVHSLDLGATSSALLCRRSFRRSSQSLFTKCLHWHCLFSRGWSPSAQPVMCLKMTTSPVLSFPCLISLPYAHATSFGSGY